MLITKISTHACQYINKKIELLHLPTRGYLNVCIFSRPAFTKKQTRPSIHLVCVYAIYCWVKGYISYMPFLIENSYLQEMPYSMKRF